MPWRGRGIWTCWTTISRKQIPCIARSGQTQPNWGPSTYWPSRTTNRRILVQVYSETGNPWTVLDFLRIPCKPRSISKTQQNIHLKLEVVKISAIFFRCFQAKWVLCFCCGKLQEKSIRRESPLNPLGQCTNECCASFSSWMTWTATSGALLRRRSITASGRLCKVFSFGSKMKQKLT